MTKPANKSRGEVALPEAGEGAFLRFNVDTLERLEGQYGEEYLDTVLKGLAKARPSVFKVATAAALQDGSMEEFPWGLSLEALELKLRDAIYLTVHGRSFAEQQKHEEELEAKRWEEIQRNPRKRQALFSMLAAEQDTAQASDPKNSDA